MPDFKPIRQSRVSEEVAEHLKQSILRGEFEPGAKLPSERVLAEQFRVSRLSIREALHKLEDLGFVVTRQGVAGGAYVIDLGFQYLSNAFSDLFLAGKISYPEIQGVRVYVEPEVARMAALNVTPEFSRRLKETYEAEGRPSQTPSEGFEKQTAVHFALAHMCGNRLFEAIVRSALELTYKYMTIVDVDHKDFGILHPVAAHRPVVEAVLAGDPKKAYSAMKKHAIEFGEILLKLEEAYRENMSN